MGPDLIFRAPLKMTLATLRRFGYSVKPHKEDWRTGVAFLYVAGACQLVLAMICTHDDRTWIWKDRRVIITGTIL